MIKFLIGIFGDLIYYAHSTYVAFGYHHYIVEMPANYTWLKEDMYYAYFDETGDSGFNNSPTGVFALSAILIHDRNWLASLDQVVAFRCYLRDQFHISTRAELKASWLVHNKGDIRKAGLTYPARMSAYMAAMRFGALPPRPGSIAEESGIHAQVIDL